MVREAPLQTSENQVCPSEDIYRSLRGSSHLAESPLWLLPLLPLSLQHLWVYLCFSPQLPLSRRLSHDETNIFSTPRAPTSFLHKWSSSDDIRVLPAQSRALGGPPEYLGQRQRLEDEEDDEAEGGGLASLRQFLEGGILGSGGGPPRGPGFFREEITTFIDETPLPSPTASPGPSPRRLRPLGFSPRRLSLGSPDSRAIGLPLGLSAGRRCSLTGGEGSTRAWGGSWGPGNPIFPQLTL